MEASLKFSEENDEYEFIGDAIESEVRREVGQLAVINTDLEHTGVNVIYLDDIDRSATELEDIEFDEESFYKFLAEHDEKEVEQQTKTIELNLDASEKSALNSLDLLLDELADHTLLTAAEEIMLAKRIERGDLEAKNKMILHNQRLLISMAKKYRTYHKNKMDFADIIQEGQLGLIRAAEKYDWRKGFKFSTYATWWIRRHLEEGIARGGHTVTVKKNAVTDLNTVAKSEYRLYEKLARQPTIEEISEDSGFDCTKVKEHLEYRERRDTGSLNTPVSKDGDVEVGDLIPSQSTNITEEALSNVSTEVRGKALKKAMDEILSEREKNILMMRYGFGDYEQPLENKEIAEIENVTHSRISAIEKRAIKKLKQDAELYLRRFDGDSENFVPSIRLS